ncbi:MAG: hypothetical protein P8164_02010 [Gammaproteobacteria bacterium]|jgi:hypothetical protein
MEWEFHYHPEHNYLEIVISGALSSHELNQLAAERQNKLRELNCGKVLFDFSQVTGMLATAAIYHRPQEIAQLGILSGNRNAAVVPEIYWKDFKFMETVYRNQGYDLNVFLNKDEALAHLINTD